jgi:hypothetical protein
VQSIIVFERQSLQFNQNYGYGNISIEVLPNGGSVLNAWGNVTKLVDGKITVSYYKF